VLTPGAGGGRLIARVSVASAIMGGAVWWLAGDMRRWFAMHTWERVAQTGLCVTAGAAVYFAVLYAAGARAADLRH
jgi:putative peptidoglycan lipid II flippase